MRVKKNDTVVVISGKDRGKRARVLQVMPKDARALVEGVNMVKRHTKPNPQKNVKGGVLTKEAPIHISNILVVDPDDPQNRPTRVGRKILDDGMRVRIARRSGAVLGTRHTAPGTRHPAPGKRTRHAAEELPPELPVKPLPMRDGERVDLERAIARLPHGYRAVLVLHDLEGYTHEEISRHLQIAVGTSKSQLFDARRAMRALLRPSAEAGHA